MRLLDESEFRMVDIDSESRKSRFLSYFEQHAWGILALVGALFALFLPLAVLIWKIDLCDYTWSSDFSGVFVCLPPFAGLGALVGAGIGKIIEIIFKRTSLSENVEIVIVAIGLVLTAALALASSIVPAFMLAFPDC